MYACTNVQYVCTYVLYMYSMMHVLLHIVPIHTQNQRELYLVQCVSDNLNVDLIQVLLRDAFLKVGSCGTHREYSSDGRD